MPIHGTVSPGYEPVRVAFEKNFSDGLESSAQLCAYVDGKQVVDLWGSDKDDYGPDSLHTVFSNTKSLTAISIACMVDRGLLDYGEKVSTYWPEFANNGKGDIKLENVMRHEAGLAWLDHSFTPDELTTASIKQNAVGRIIEAEPCRFPPAQCQTRREYHAATRGLILNEIFRRVEPEGRTLGEFLRAEISDRLGADAFIGVTKEELARFQNGAAPGAGKVLLGCMTPSMLGGNLEIRLGDMFKMTKLFYQRGKREGNVKPPPTLQSMAKLGFVDAVQTDEVRQAELPSGNAGCTARGLARIAACVANRGELDGVRIMREETFEKMHSNFEAGRDWALFLGTTEFSQGGVARFNNRNDEFLSNPARAGYVGWSGFGGSVFQWNPEERIGFAYIPTRLAWYDMKNVRAGLLQQKLVECVKNVRG